MQGLRGRKSDGEDGDVILLAVGLGYAGDFCGGSGAEVAGAVEAEEFAAFVLRFYYAIGDEGEAVAGAELESDLLVVRAIDDAQRERGGDGEFLSVEIRGKVAGVGQGKCALGWRSRRRGR